MTNLSAQELGKMVNGLLTKINGHDQEIASREIAIAAKDRETLYRLERLTKIKPQRHERSDALASVTAPSPDEVRDAGYLAVCATLYTASYATSPFRLKEKR